jgi:hypothetical protein
MNTLVETCTARNAALNPFVFEPTTPVQEPLADTTEPDGEGSGKGLRRMFAFSRIEELGCVDWYQYPDALAAETAARAH